MSHRPVAAALLLSPTLLAQSADPAEASAPISADGANSPCTGAG